MTKYIHDEQTHHLKDPDKIVPVIMELLQPKSVVDIGCGIGTFLHVFKREGVQDILGIDGPWVNRELLSKYIKPEEFLEADLEKGLSLDKSYDLVVSLEVAEHLAPSAADTFVKNLVNAGEVILFSAAIPLQGGQNHINEQWLSYWEAKFLKHHYGLQDVIRPLFWNDPEISWWYKQNMVLFTPKGFELRKELRCCPMTDVVHYECFTFYASERNTLLQGKAGFRFYARHSIKILARKILGRRIRKLLKTLLRR